MLQQYLYLYIIYIYYVTDIIYLVYILYNIYTWYMKAEGQGWKNKWNKRIQKCQLSQVVEGARQNEKLTPMYSKQYFFLIFYRHFYFPA